MRMLLGIGGLSLMWLLCGTGCAQPKEAEAKDEHWPKAVVGRGETIEVAKRDALAEAVKQVKLAMKLHKPALGSYEVTEEYVTNHLLEKNSGQPGEDVKVDGIPQPFKAWVVKFRSDPATWSDLIRRDHEVERKLRAEHRHTLGAQAIIGLACLLCAGFGYVRLDEYTHRRYTTFLRLVGLGLASTLLAGWWWIFIQTTG